MKNFKKINSVLLISLFIIVLGGCTHTPIETPHDNYPPADKSVQSEDLQMMEISVDAKSFSDLEELTNWAHHLIRGFVIDERVETRNVGVTKEEERELLTRDGYSEEEIEFILSVSSFEPRYQVITIYRVQILEVFQGDLNEGEIIEVGRVGGIYNDNYWFINRQVTLNPGEEFVIFLWEGVSTSPFALASTFQGVYQIDNNLLDHYDYIVDVTNVDFEFENVGINDPLIVTIEDLIDIVEGELSSERSRQRRNNRRSTRRN